MIPVSQTFKTAIGAPVKALKSRVKFAWSRGISTTAGVKRFIYEDETTNVLSWSVSQKASNNPWGVVRSTLTLTLDNASGRYTPYEGTAPTPTPGSEDPKYYCGLARIPVMVEVGIGNEYIPQFTGYVISTNYDITNRTVTFEVGDSFTLLEGELSDIAAVETAPNVIMSALIGVINTPTDAATTSISLEPGVQAAIGYFAGGGNASLDLLDEICQSEQYILFCDEYGSIVGWNANHFSTQPDAQDWRFDFDNSVDMAWDNSAIINSVEVVAEPMKSVYQTRFYNNTDPSEDWLVPAEGEVEIFFDLNNSDAEIIALDYGEIEYNGRGSYYLTNTALDGSGDDNHEAIAIESAYNLGDTVKITFSNSSETPTYITALSLFGDSAQRAAEIRVQAQDTDSIAKYSANPDNNGAIETVTSNYIQDEAFAKSVARRLLDFYGSPFTRLNASTFFVPQLQFGDQILAEAGQFGERDTLILGIERSCSADAGYAQRVYLEEREAMRFFTLNQSELDGPDVLAF